MLLAALGLQLAVAPARAAAAEASSPDHDAVSIPVVFPEHSIDEPDAYLCTAVTLPDRPLKLVGVQPTSDEKIVHHMLLFGGWGWWGAQGRRRAPAAPAGTAGSFACLPPPPLCRNAVQGTQLATLCWHSAGCRRPAGQPAPDHTPPLPPTAVSGQAALGPRAPTRRSGPARCSPCAARPPSQFCTAGAATRLPWPCQREPGSLSGPAPASEPSCCRSVPREGAWQRRPACL